VLYSSPYHNHDQRPREYPIQFTGIPNSTELLFIWWLAVRLESLGKLVSIEIFNSFAPSMSAGHH